MKTTISDHAAVAKLIRTELKAKFPTVKFSVTASRYAGGSSVRIDYEDGPLYDDVMNIGAKYEYGSFDGMEDIYNYDNVIADVPQVKYVLVQRSSSDTNTRALIKEISNTYAGCQDMTIENYYNMVVAGWDCYGSVLVNRMFAKRDYTKIFICPYFDTSMTELHEMTEGKNFAQLQSELSFQLANGESLGGEICGNIRYAIESMEKH